MKYQVSVMEFVKKKMLNKGYDDEIDIITGVLINSIPYSVVIEPSTKNTNVHTKLSSALSRNFATEDKIIYIVNSILSSKSFNTG